MNIEHERVNNKRVLDNDHFVTRKKIRAIPRPSDHIDMIRMKRPNLTRIKQLLYTAGKLVHGKSTINYDKVFYDYWIAFERRLQGPMNAFDLIKNQNALQSFLRNTALRKLHNQLVLGMYHGCFVCNI